MVVFGNDAEDLARCSGGHLRRCHAEHLAAVAVRSFGRNLFGLGDQRNRHSIGPIERSCRSNRRLRRANHSLRLRIGRHSQRREVERLDRTQTGHRGQIVRDKFGLIVNDRQRPAPVGEHARPGARRALLAQLFVRRNRPPRRSVGMGIAGADPGRLRCQILRPALAFVVFDLGPGQPAGEHDPEHRTERGHGQREQNARGNAERRRCGGNDQVDMTSKDQVLEQRGPHREAAEPEQRAEPQRHDRREQRVAGNRLGSGRFALGLAHVSQNPCKNTCEAAIRCCQAAAGMRLCTGGANRTW